MVYIIWSVPMTVFEYYFFSFPLNVRNSKIKKSYTILMIVPHATDDIELGVLAFRLYCSLYYHLII